MKPVLILFSILSTGCEPPDPAVSSGSTIYQMGDTETLKIKAITIDGNEYLAFKASDGRWGLCPRSTVKAEAATPVTARPVEPQKSYYESPKQTNR